MGGGTPSNSLIWWISEHQTYLFGLLTSVLCNFGHTCLIGLMALMALVVLWTFVEPTLVQVSVSLLSEFWWAIQFLLLGAPIYLPLLFRACMWARIKISKTLVLLICPLVLLKGARSSCWNYWRHRGSSLAAIWAADRLCADHHHHHHHHHHNNPNNNSSSNKNITTNNNNKNTNTATTTTIREQTTDSITGLWPKILATALQLHEVMEKG